MNEPSETTSGASLTIARVQALGAKIRAAITALAIHNADTDRALSLQSEGDRALRDHDLVRAVENYGRAEEAVSVLQRERVSAREARARTDDELRRAQRAGANVANAESYSTRGDQALETGNYHTAEVYYAEARILLDASKVR